jgi:hypothetical protein
MQRGLADCRSARNQTCRSEMESRFGDPRYMPHQKPDSHWKMVKGHFEKSKNNMNSLKNSRGDFGT